MKNPRSKSFFWAVASFCIVLYLNAQSMERPNILWIVAEDISPMFGCYGDKDAHTPNIDSFAEKSFLFSNAYATSPICAPSRSTLATGMYSTSLGSQHLRTTVALPDSVKPLAEVFRKNGYWVSNRGKTDYNFSADGLFDYWGQDTDPWKRRDDGKPFFSFMNLGSTHEGSGNLSEKARDPLSRLDGSLRKNPEKIELPPYFLDTPEMRRLWARYHDLITVWDIEVGEVLSQLESDGLLENTVVFIMADHGLGMPRYKRWLYSTGLRVPLIVHIPEKFGQFRFGGRSHSVEERLVSYVDLPATALTLAGIPVPEHFHGESLFGEERQELWGRKHVFGSRDRADDMYDLSRCVFDGRYLYIRHFHPHLPPIQEGVIFNPWSKESMIELHSIRKQGLDTEVSTRLWEARPVEELYDLQEDPQELDNIVGRPDLQAIRSQLSDVLRDWILETRDSGFLNEAEMHIRAQSAGLTPYEMLQDEGLYPLEEILKHAELASRGKLIATQFDHPDPAVRYWVVLSAIISGNDDASTLTMLQAAARDVSPVVRATAAEALGRLGQVSEAVAVFRELLKMEDPVIALYVARSLALSLENVRPLEEEIRSARERCLSVEENARFPWKDFEHSAFTAWALEWALIKSGLSGYEEFQGW